MLNFNLISIFSIVLLSCSSSGKTYKINKDFTIISAEKSTWFGGREGVKGHKYIFVLKNNQKKKFDFKNLRVGKDLFPLRVTLKNEAVFLTAITSVPNPPSLIDVKTGIVIADTTSKVENGDVSLEYFLSDSKTVYRLPVINVKEVKSSTTGEALPN